MHSYIQFKCIYIAPAHNNTKKTPTTPPVTSALATVGTKTLLSAGRNLQQKKAHREAAVLGGPNDFSCICKLSGDNT